MVLARFLPQDQRFYTFFREAADNANEAAKHLVNILDDFTDLERKVRRMRDMEHRGDEITHQLFNALNSTFMTPLDREDIRDLASKLDDLVDYMDQAARHLLLFRIEAPTDLARLLARVLSEQAALVAEAVPMLEHAKERDELIRRTIEINRLENEADDLYSQALSTLFDGATDIPSVIKAIRWGDLYGLLEGATDRAEDVADTLEGITLKHA